MKRWLASLGAILAGLLVTGIASTAADAFMRAVGIFPAGPDPMPDGLFAVAAGYRALFTIAGAYVTARLAPDRPMLHAAILAALGVLAGLAGIIAYYKLGGSALGPAWYPISIPITALPCVWLGARLATARRNGPS